MRTVDRRLHAVMRPEKCFLGVNVETVARRLTVLRLYEWYQVPVAIFECGVQSSSSCRNFLPILPGSVSSTGQ